MPEDAPFEGFSNKKGEKTGGIHASDREGGIYKSLDGNNTYLIKRDVSKLHNDIAEFMAAQLFDELCPGSACEISLHQSIETGRTFLASKFFKDGYRDLFSDLGKKKRNANLETAQAWMPGNQQYVRKGLSSKTQGEFNYQNYERTTAASLLLGDKSVHSGNIGVLDKNGQKELVRIDFGAAFRELSPEINPKKSVKNRLGLEKNYFLRDHPTKRTYTKEFSDELKREAAIDLGPRIEKAWHQIVQNYDNDLERDAILRFAKQIGVPEESLAIENPAIQLEAIHDFFAKIMQERQQSQLDMAFEIDLKLAINKDKSIDIEKLQAAIAENPKHAEFIVDNPSKLQLKFKLSKKQRAILSDEVENYKQKLASQELAQQPTVTTEQAHDRVVFTSKTITPAKRTPAQATSVNLNEAIDPITLAVREEIISTQQLLLQKEIARTMHGEEQQTFAEQDLSEVQTYLKSEEGQASVAEIMKNPIVQTQMHEIESAGYKAVHNKFKDNFRDIEWAPVTDSTTRSTEITNDSGQSICTLKETTVKTQPTAFTLSDETSKNVSAYRHIDFPKKLNNNNGPMHLSMAVKDANGDNIAEKDAVYFTAHYDDSGKLTEVSSPIPVKFMGSGDDAIGYIERNGEIYTLPVTQGKYHEMMQEVAKNNGMNIDLSQEATISVQPKTKTQAVEHTSGELEQQPQIIPEIQTPTPVLEEVSTQPLKAAAIKDLHKLRGYFDDTLSKMKIEALENGVEFNAEKYNALTQKWHELCDNSIELLNTSSKDLTQEQLKEINSATIIMEKSVSPQFSAVFLEDQEHYLQRWGEIIPKKGAALIEVSQNIVTQHAKETTLEKYLEEEQAEINGLDKQAKAARLHALATELEETYPEFAVVTNKLEKGKNKKKGTYDIKLDNETYLELYETCRKVELGLTSPEDAALTVRNTLNEQLSTRRKVSSFLSRKPKQQPQTQEAEQVPTEELDILKDLKLFRGYFEKTLTLMQANAEKNNIPFDIRKYDEAVQKWHELCDQTIESVTATSQHLTQEQIDAISTARAHMAKPVNPEFVKIFIKKPDYYLERWSEVLAEKGNVLLKISKDIEKEITLQYQQIPSERETVNELDGQTRTAKLHNMVQGLMAEHPELAPIDKKLQKGRNNKGTYDIKLDTETYLELYKACKKIELGIASDIDHEVTNIRSILNQNLSLSRRFKHRNNRKSTQLPEEVQVDTPSEQLSASNSSARELASKWKSVTATIPVSHPTSEEQQALQAEPIIHDAELDAAHGNTEAHVHAMHGEVDKIKKLGYNGMHHCNQAFNTPNNDGITPLMMAIQSENVELIAAMVSVGVKLDQEHLGCTPIELAINTDNYELVTTLLNDHDLEGHRYESRMSGIENPDQVLANGDTLLIAAIKSGNFQAATALIDLGADINKPGINNISPAQHAAAAIIEEGGISKNNTDKSAAFFEYILDSGADVFHKNAKGVSLIESVNHMKDMHKTDEFSPTRAAEKTLVASFEKKAPSGWKKLVHLITPNKHHKDIVLGKNNKHKEAGNTLKKVTTKIEGYKLEKVVKAQNISAVKVQEQSQSIAPQKRRIEIGTGR